MKRFISIIAVVVMVITLAACGAGNGGSETNEPDATEEVSGTTEEAPDTTGAEEPVTLMYGTPGPVDNASTANIVYMIEYLENIGSSIKIDAKYNGALGSEREMAEQVIMGSLAMCDVSDISMTPMMPEIVFACFPGIYKDYEDVETTYYNGWIGEEVKKICENNGIRALGFVHNGFRWISNSKRPVTSGADLQGLKIRVPETDYLVKFFEDFGSLPTPVPFPELATALQQGVVDGQETSIVTSDVVGIAEFNPYFTAANHGHTARIMLINQGVWSSLSEKQQKELQEAIDYATPKQWEDFVSYDEDCVKRTVETTGNEVVYPDDAFWQEIVDEGKKIANSNEYVELFGQDIVDRMYS
jgi:TRAP-type C4-dicarboxylate transport system substrate-binding protein